MVGGYQIIDLKDCTEVEEGTWVLLNKIIGFNKSIKLIGIKGLVSDNDVIGSWNYLTIDGNNSILESYPIDGGDESPYVFKVTISAVVLESDSGERYNTMIELGEYQEK